MVIFEVFPIVSLRGISTGIPIFQPEIDQIVAKLPHVRLSPLLGGDLNPVLGFCFPLFSIGLPGGIAISVENSGM